MQNYILGWSDRIRERMKAADYRISIADAVKGELETADRLMLFKLAAAGDDLTRIVQLELQRRDDVREAAEAEGDRYRFGGPNYDQASTPDGV